MEITYIDEKNVRIKGKQVTLTTQLPAGKVKTPTDAVLLIGNNRSTEFFNQEAGVVFQGAGEYEVKGTKVTGFSAGEEVMFTVRLDGLSIFIGQVSGALLMKDKLHEHDIAVLIANDVLSEAVMSMLSARVFVFLGEKSDENAKAFEKSATKVGKYVVAKDKLPAETEFIFLG